MHGLLLLLASREFERLAAMWPEYECTDVDATAYDGRSVRARALVSRPEWRLAASLAPHESPESGDPNVSA